VFSNQEVLDRLKELDVMLVQADNTAREQVINDDLARFGRNNLPTNIIFPADPDAPAIILPELLDPATALEALEQAVAAGE